MSVTITNYNSDLIQDTDLIPFERSLDVYGLKLVALPALGGVVGVEDDFVKKVAQTVKMLLNPNAPDIDTEFQSQLISNLSTLKTIQRIGSIEYDAYTPVLDNNFYPGWDIVNDSHSVTDFIWQFRTKSSTNQITETIEHLLHTITNFGLIGPYPTQFNVKTPSEGERDSVIENLPVYNYEGIAYYVDSVV